MTEQTQFDTLLNFFKVLGNESRLKILGLLANQERSVGELAEFLGVKEPTVSHHLAMMKELGLVQMRAEGNNRIYWLDARSLESLNKNIFSRAGLAKLVDHQSADEWEAKVLRAFLDGERVIDIPAQYKKQQVILRWMLEKFQKGVQYTEKEVNEIIKQHHPDSAWFRRSFIDHKLMVREKGVYWRIEEGVRSEE